MGYKIMEYLGVTCDIIGKERLPRADERTLFVSNHPLGGVDGIIYAALLGEHYGGQLRIPVNDLLLAVYQFRDIFLPSVWQAGPPCPLLTPRGTFDGPQQVLTFPAGLVSRLNKRGGATLRGNLASSVWHSRASDRWSPSFLKARMALASIVGLSVVVRWLEVSCRVDPPPRRDDPCQRSALPHHRRKSPSPIPLCPISRRQQPLPPSSAMSSTPSPLVIPVKPLFLMQEPRNTKRSSPLDPPALSAVSYTSK